MAETSIVGEITERNSSFREVTWKINKLFSLSSEEGYKIRSPAFHFVGVNCNLSVCPNGTKAAPGEIIVSLFLRMMNWQLECPPVVSEICIKSNDGTLVKSNVTLEKNLVNGKFMACHFNKTEVIQNKDLFDPEENLTIYCKLTVGENYRIDKASETERQVKLATGEFVFVGTENCIDLSCCKEVHVQTEQQYRLVEKVLQDFKKLLDNEDDTDVTIKVKEKEFKVHKGILGVRTSVFATMFKHDMSEKNTGIVTLDDCEPDIFKDFLHYVYTGTVNSLSDQNAFGLYKLADKYQVDDLKEECLDCLKNILSVETFCKVIILSLKHNERELLILATEFFCRKMNEIIVTVEWQSFMSENPSYANELLIKRMQYEQLKMLNLQINHKEGHCHSMQ